MGYSRRHPDPPVPLRTMRLAFLPLVACLESQFVTLGDQLLALLAGSLIFDLAGSVATMVLCPLKFFPDLIFRPVLSPHEATLLTPRRFVTIPPQTSVPSPGLRGHTEL
jgi:hypothetical protein